MCRFKGIIQKGDIADDPEDVCKDCEFIGITEMTVDVLLFRVGTGSSLGGHSSISHLVRGDIRVILIISLESSDEGVDGLWIIFGNIELNAGGIEGKDIRQGGIDEPAEGFDKIGHGVEHLLDERFKSSFEAGKQGSIRDFGEAAEIP